MFPNEPPKINIKIYKRIQDTSECKCDGSTTFGSSCALSYFGL